MISPGEHSCEKEGKNARCSTRGENFRIAQLIILIFSTISDILRGLGAPGTQVIRRLRLLQR